MALRVNEFEVREIISTSLTSIQPHMTAASLRVDAAVARSSRTPTAAELKELERWLAAHFVAISRPRRDRVALGGEVEYTYALGTLGKGLESTTFGQTALAIDPTGELANLGLQPISMSVSA